MTLLSLLTGEQGSAGRLAWKAGEEPHQPAGDAELKLLATRSGSGTIAALVYYSRDRIISQGSRAVTLRFDHLPFEQAMLAHYRIDEEHADPYRLWEEAGAPGLPGEALLQDMRAEQEPALVEEPHPAAIHHGSLELSFDLPLHGVSLLLLQPRPENGPAPIRGLQAERYAGLHDRPEYLLRWDPLPSRAIRTYEVQRAEAPGGVFQRVNVPDLLCSAYMIGNRPGCYRVTARDFWGRLGEPSTPIQIP